MGFGLTCIYSAISMFRVHMYLGAMWHFDIARKVAVGQPLLVGG